MDSHVPTLGCSDQKGRERGFLSLAGANNTIPGDPRATRIEVLTITLTVLCTVTETTGRFKELLFSKIDNTKSA